MNDDTDNDSVVSVDSSKKKILPTELINSETLDNLKQIDRALKDVGDGLDKTDQELDELSDLAKEMFNNLSDLGMQVDSRFSAEIFNSAAAMMGHALTAKTAKINKKLKLIDLKLKKAELDRKLEANKSEEAVEHTQLGTGTVLDRNELLRMIMSQNNSEEKSSKTDK